MNPDNTPLDPDVVNLAKSVKQVESSGNIHAVGASGEYGAYQWLPETWAKQSAAAGVNVPLKDATNAQQNQVWYTWAKGMKDKGYGPAQIASMQNAGEGAPNAYEQNYVGTNKEGVNYNTPKYVQEVMQLYNQNKGQQPQGITADALSPQSSGGIAADSLSGDSGNPFAKYASTANSGDSPDQSDTLGGQFNSRVQEAENAISQAESGQINPISGVLQTAGAAGGLVGDVVNDTLKLVPGVSQAEGLLGKGIGALANTGVGKQVVGAGESFAQQHPELAGDIGAVGNIASVVPIFEGVGLAKDAIGGVLTGVGKDALVDAISPEIKAGTKAGARDALENGTVKSGLLGNVTRVPDPEMVEAAPVVKEVAPNFMKLGTNSERLNAVQKGIGKLATKLQDNLSTSEMQPILTPEDLQTLQDGITTQVQQNPLLVGDAGKQAQQIFDQFKRFLPQQGDVTMSDVLAARKKLDSWISNIKGDTVFDPKTENAISVGLRAVRQGANDLIDKKVPEGEVKKLLRKQTLLYKVSDNLAPKASKEVDTNVVTRFAKRHPGLMKAGKYAAGSAITGLGLGEAQKILGGQ